MLRKKLTCLLLAVTVGLQPLAAHAVNLGSAFNNLLGGNAATHVNAPGHYQSGARNGFSGGGVELRVPRTANAPSLFSVTPPKIEAGCNGISAHFGGFSFISGQEFVDLLKKIASGAALGFVTSLAMKTLCPQCEAVVQELKTAAQLAAKLARESCAIGAELGKKFMSGMSTSGEPYQKCAVTSANNNGDGDALFAFDNLCSTLESASTALHDFNESASNTIDEWAGNGTGTTGGGGGTTAAKTNSEIGEGNITWLHLSAFDGGGLTGATVADAYHRKLVLMNIMGANLVWSKSGKVSCETGDGKTWEAIATEAGKEHFCAPPMDAEKMVGYLMCGSAQAVKDAKSASSASSVVKYCAKYFSEDPNNTENKAWTCSQGATDTLCNSLKLGDPSQIFQGKGFLMTINELLREAVTRVRNNEDFASVQRGIDGKTIIQLIQVAPYPLYQAINAAAVYPTAAEDLIDTISVLVAEQFAYAMFDEIIRLKGRTSNGGVKISKAQADQLLAFIEQLRATNYQRRQQMAQNLNLQQGLSEQIRQINLAIQRQVLSADMLSTGRMANTLNKAVNATAGAGASSTPATGP